MRSRAQHKQFGSHTRSASVQRLSLQSIDGLGGFFISCGCKGHANLSENDWAAQALLALQEQTPLFILNANA